MSEQDLLKYKLELETGRKVINVMGGNSGAVYILDQGENTTPRKLAYKSVKINGKLTKEEMTEKKSHFLDECELWLQIHSQYIATAFYPKIIGDNLFIVMPFYDCSLHSLLVEVAEGKKKISYLDGLVIVSKITKALIELKRSGIKYHQDFNPPNILIELLDKKYREFPTNNYLNCHIVIADFGMADLRERIGQTYGGGGGKFPYKAPEQYFPKKYKTYDPDIFALGVMIYMIFSGKHPNGSTNKKALTSPGSFKSWSLSEDKSIVSLENTDLQNYINEMLKNDPADRPVLDDFYAFILGELEKEDSRLHHQVVGLFKGRDAFDQIGNISDRLYRLNKVAGLSDELEKKVFDKLMLDLNNIKLKLITVNDVVNYLERMRYLNYYFKKGYLLQDVLKKKYFEHVHILFKWYKEIKLNDCPDFKKVECEGYVMIDIVKSLGIREYEAANNYIHFAIDYLLDLERESTIEALFEGFKDDVFLSHFYYSRAFDCHQKDIYKTLYYLDKAKEKYPTEAIFYCKEGKWIKQYLHLWQKNVLPLPSQLSKSQREELEAKMQSAFDQFDVL